METQWPCFYVFEKPRQEAAFIHAGSVHAPDLELALLIARDVFARRPSRTAMWIAPESAIFSRTKEQLATGEHPGEGDPKEERDFQVFAKTSQKGVCVHQGTVRAREPWIALAAAQQAFPKVRALVWWLIPDDSLLKSDPEQAALLYGSSPGKEYRHERNYPVRTMMREIMARNQQTKKDGHDG